MLHVPLNPDAYFTLILAQANQGPFQDTFGSLDASGRASARSGLPAGSNPAFAGLRLEHAAVAFAGFDLALVSGTTPLVLVP